MSEELLSQLPSRPSDIRGGGPPSPGCGGRFLELSWLSWSRTHARSSADRGAMPRRRRRRVAQGPQAPDVGAVGGGELTSGVQGGEADFPSQPLRHRRRGNLIRAAGELEELQSESKLNRGCEYCGWWHPNSPFPFPNCNLCGARPSYHHGRCCPQRPRNPSRLCTLCLRGGDYEYTLWPSANWWTGSLETGVCLSGRLAAFLWSA